MCGSRILECGQLVEAQPHGGERRAQLVRDVGRELALAADELRDLDRGGIQGAGDAIELGEVEAPGTRGEVALPQPRRRGRQPLHRLDKAAGLQHGETGGRGRAQDREHADEQPHLTAAPRHLVGRRVDGHAHAALRGAGAGGQAFAGGHPAEPEPRTARVDHRRVTGAQEAREVRGVQARFVARRGRDAVGLALQPRERIAARP